MRHSCGHALDFVHYHRSLPRLRRELRLAAATAHGAHAYARAAVRKWAITTLVQFLPSTRTELFQRLLLTEVFPRTPVQLVAAIATTSKAVLLQSSKTNAASLQITCMSFATLSRCTPRAC